MFKEVNIKDLDFNPSKEIADSWMLVTAGTKETGYNTMTASWGATGSLWNGNRPVSIIFVRPQRYTKEFVDREEYYSLSFYSEEHHQALAYLGTHSGKDEDKVAKVGFTPEFDDKTTWFKEAKLVFICKKLYRQTLEEKDFIDQEVMEKSYPKRDFHDVYVGEIVKVLVNE